MLIIINENMYIFLIIVKQIIKFFVFALAHKYLSHNFVFVKGWGGRKK